MGLNELAKELFSAKQAEADAKAHRIALEEQCANLISTEENGSRTVTTDCGLKVCVKRGLTYKTDIDALRGIEGGKELLKTTTVTKLDEKLYEKVRSTHPGLFMAASEFITVKPKKVSVTLKA